MIICKWGPITVEGALYDMAMIICKCMGRENDQGGALYANAIYYVTGVKKFAFSCFVLNG